MEIQLTEEYRITSDSEQFIVQKMSIIQDGKFTKAENIGKPKWSDIGYFPKVNQALKFVSNNILLTNKDLDIIINKLNLLDIKIEAIRGQLENTRISELIKVMETSEQIEDEIEMEEYLND